MKINNKFMLLVGSCFALLSAAELSKLAERAALLKETDDMEKTIEIINTKQQESKIAESKSADDRNYIVIIKKEDGAYVRVAHFKKDKVGIKITEDVLLKIIEEAEKKLGDSSESMPYEFKIGGTDYYAVISKKNSYLIFNITSSKEEINKFLGISEKPDVKEEKKPEPKKEEPKAEDKKTEAADSIKVETEAKNSENSTEIKK